MEFDFRDAIPILGRTPRVLRAQLQGLPETWLRATEGPGTWSPFDVVGHLIHGERTDWIPRAELILEHGETRVFPPFDRVAMFEASRGKTIDELLETFETLRSRSLDRLRGLNPGAADLDRTGRHPEFGVVTLRQHLATWVAHDLGHVAQIERVMARQYRDEVGPWRKYLSLLGPA